MVNFPIDFVVPYVNNFDQVWRKTYTDYCLQHNMKGRIDAIDKERYRDFGYLIFLFRGIAQNMPFIRKVFLIVSNPEQVPDWVDQEKVQVVLHKDIIPSQYLPTFNSTTIEMFIPDIKDLSEHFIYGNDDIYTINPTTAEDYFTDDGRVKIKMDSHIKMPSDKQYWKVCYKNCIEIVTKLNKELQPAGSFHVPSHSLTPIIKKNAIKARKLLGQELFDSISNFRTDENFNQYIYTHYAYYTDDYADSKRIVEYVNMGRKNTNNILIPLEQTRVQELIINDTETTDKSYWRRYNQIITKAFLKKFPEKCKYEK